MRNEETATPSMDVPATSGSLTMALAVDMAAAKVVEAIAIVEGTAPFVAARPFAALERPFTSQCGVWTTAILAKRAEGDAAFAGRLAAISDRRLQRDWEGVAEVCLAADEPEDDADLEIAMIRRMAVDLMEEALAVEVLGLQLGMVVSTHAPFAGLAVDDATTVAAIADAPACPDGSRVLLGGDDVLDLADGARPATLADPTWRQLIEGARAAMGKGARRTTRVFFEGVFPLDAALHGHATHAVCMGS